MLRPRSRARSLLAVPLLGSTFLAAPLLSGVCSAADPVRAGNSEWFRDENTPVRVDDAGTHPAPLPAPAPDPTVAAPPTAPARDDGRGRRDTRAGTPPFGNYTPGYAPGSGNYGFLGYPSGEINSFVVAQARAATARALFRRADSELSAAFRDAARSFEMSAEWRQAVAAEKSAYDDLNAARRKAVQTLASDAKYQRLLSLRQDVAERLEEGRATKTLTPAEILAMATLKMHYAMDMRVSEATALNAEPSVKENQDKLVAAGTRVADLRMKHEDAIRHDPDLVEARRNLEDARIARITAEAYLHGADLAGATALDYAYWANRYSRYGLNSSYAGGAFDSLYGGRY